MLKNVLPHPLKESFSIAQANSEDVSSDIWQSDITFEKGNRYLISAPSGKGKSTFLHLMYGLRRDYQGDIFIDNQSVKQFKLNDWAKIRQRRLSIIFQDLRLFLDQSGWENITIKNELSQHKTPADIQIMAQRLGIENILNQSCGTMSYGQRQRVAIIRALCQPFDFLLLDEPFSHLDDQNIRNACELILQEVQQQNAGLILVSLGDDYYLNCDKHLIKKL